MRLRVYVEGGGDAASTKAACREGFSKLFRRITPHGALPKVIASGGRRKAFDNFCDALRIHRDEVIVLLVDSEGPVTTNAWAHLKTHPDEWEKPVGATDEQVHLMVQCMEAWFLADKDALVKYYGQRFIVNSLPMRPNIEEIPKQDVMRALEHASRPTQKREYHKTRHGFAILGRIDPLKVRKASACANRLFELLAHEAQQNN